MTNFDAETDQLPNEHDGLLARLAALVAPALDDVVFEEVPPAGDEMESGACRLCAYVRGKLYSLPARNLGDWYDVEAVLNLMNATAKEHGSKARFVGLASQDQTMAVVGAPAGAIARAIQGGLIEIGATGEAEKAGKSFEQQVVEGFKN